MVVVVVDVYVALTVLAAYTFHQLKSSSSIAETYTFSDRRGGRDCCSGGNGDSLNYRRSNCRCTLHLMTDQCCRLSAPFPKPTSIVFVVVEVIEGLGVVTVEMIAAGVWITRHSHAVEMPANP